MLYSHKENIATKHMQLISSSVEQYYCEVQDWLLSGRSFEMVDVNVKIKMEFTAHRAMHR